MIILDFIQNSAIKYWNDCFEELGAEEWVTMLFVSGTVSVIVIFFFVLYVWWDVNVLKLHLSSFSLFSFAFIVSSTSLFIGLGFTNFFPCKFYFPKKILWWKSDKLKEGKYILWSLHSVFDCIRPLFRRGNLVCCFFNGRLLNIHNNSLENLTNFLLKSFIIHFAHWFSCL